MKNLNEIKEIIEAYKWVRVPSKNTATISYVGNKKRLNYYFIKGTLVINKINGDALDEKAFNEVRTVAEIQEILCENQN